MRFSFLSRKGKPSHSNLHSSNYIIFGKVARMYNDILILIYSEEFDKKGDTMVKYLRIYILFRVFLDENIK